MIFKSFNFIKIILTIYIVKCDEINIINQNEVNLMYKFICSFILLAIVGCSPIKNQIGKKIDLEDIVKIKPTIHTTNDVLQILGSPSTIAPFNKNKKWIYIYNETQRKAFFTPTSIELNIIEITFNENKIVQEIRIQNENSSKPIFIEQKETPTEGHDIGFFQQIFGNFGRIHHRK